MASDLPYPQDAGRTHWDGCWRDRGHHNCAVFEVERLLAEMDRMRDALEEIRAEFAEADAEYRSPTELVCAQDWSEDGARTALVDLREHILPIVDRALNPNEEEAS